MSPRAEGATAPAGRGATDGDVLLDVRGLVKHFTVGGGLFGGPPGTVRAVDGVSFGLRRGETLGLVGESGCGKTTAGRAILRLIEPTAGTVSFDGQDVLAATSARCRKPSCGPCAAACR